VGRLHDNFFSILSEISNALTYAAGLGATFEITVSFDLKEYRDRNLYCFIFGNDFTQILAIFNMKFTVTLITD
jgi:hypothetical protein